MFRPEKLFGYREYRLTGEDFERFFNAANQEYIHLHTVRPADGGITFRAWLTLEGDLTEIAEELGLRLERISEGGLPVFISKYRHRYGIMAGMILTALFLAVTSLFVYEIKIEGHHLLYEDDLRRVLRESGLYEGVLVKDVDCGVVKLKLLEEFDNIAYAYVNLKGNHAEVRIVESDLPPTLDPEYPCNIIASDNGQIIRFETYKGEACAIKGEGVKQGQLLVSGVIDSKRIGYRTVHASALVLARTKQTVTLNQPYLFEEEALSGDSEKVYTLEIMGISMTFGKKASDFESFYEETRRQDLALNNGSVLPISLTETVRYELTKSTKKLTREEAAKRLAGQIKEIERVSFFGLEIEDKEEELTYTEKGVTLTATYTVIKNIAKEQEIFVSPTQ